jgi:hypothetical protein
MSKETVSASVRHDGKKSSLIFCVEDPNEYRNLKTFFERSSIFSINLSDSQKDGRQLVVDYQEWHGKAAVEAIQKIARGEHQNATATRALNHS